MTRAQKSFPIDASRKPRADGLRNRMLIIQVAKDAFTQKGAGASLDDIAKTAGVGAGTLYRHFPTREALLQGVYSAEVDKLAEAAATLAHAHPPLKALRAWLTLFIDYLNSKKIIAPALSGHVGGERVIQDGMSKVHKAVETIYTLAIKSGAIRPDVKPIDHLLAVLGVLHFGAKDGAKDAALRLVDTLIAGSRPPQS